MFIAQISLQTVTNLPLLYHKSLMSEYTMNFALTQTTKKKINSHPCIAPCVNMWSFFFFFFFFSHLLNDGACICHIAQEGQVEWTTPTEVRGKQSQIPQCHKLHCFYSITHPCQHYKTPVVSHALWLPQV